MFASRAITLSRTALTAAAITLASIAGSADAAVKYQRVHGTQDEERSLSIERTSDGGYITCGYRLSGNDYNVYVVKHNSLGAPVWSRTYGGQATDVGYSIRQTSDGGYIIACETNSVNTNLGIGLIRIDAFGNVLWSRVYWGSAFTGGRFGTTVRELITPSGTQAFAVIGRETLYAATGAPLSQRGVLIKTDAAGNVTFHRSYADPRGNTSFVSFNDFRWMRQDPSNPNDINGGYIIVGSTQQSSTALKQAVAFHATGNGNQLWAVDYGQTQFSEEADSVELNPGTVNFTMSMADPSLGGTGGTRLLQAQLASPTVWSFGYPNIFTSQAALRVMPNRDIVHAGWTTVAGANVTDGAAQRVSPAGAPIWAWRYGGTANDRLEAVAPNVDNGVNYGGWTNSFGFGQNDGYILRTLPNGSTGCFESPMQLPIIDKQLPEQFFQWTISQTPETTQWPLFIKEGTQDKILCLKKTIADFNADDFIDFTDFDDFVKAFEAGDEAADINEDGFLDFTDFDAFVFAFENGL
ncbi:MAG: hypothetical protein SFY96_07600 [Planctomycetota bacterium]|nr:hypothetical protein [Planctomycetota bacterium]